MKDKSKYIGSELKYLKEVLKSGKLTSTSGDFVYRFEQEFANSFGSKYAVACNAGTSALHMALEGLDVSCGDEVIVPALSVIMNTTSILHANATPVYADVDEETFTIDPESVKKKITKKTKAIQAVSLYGYPSKIEELKFIANSIPIIEDNAEHLGNLRSKAATYSLEGTKHFSAGEMGVVLTNDEDVALKARKLSNHGFITTKADNGRTKSDVNVFQNPDFKRHDTVGWNYRCTEFQAAIALAQLEKKEQILNIRRYYAMRFYETYQTKSKIFKPQAFHCDHTFWTFAVRCLEDKKFWHNFHDKFVSNGGDGFWSAWQLQYREPVMDYGNFIKRCPDIYTYLTNLPCVVAETIQPQLIQHKFNYRTEKMFERQLKALRKTLKSL